MPAPASSSAAASPPPPPRAMKRELAFALQSLSEISASPGRTRSGRPIAHPDPASSAATAKRRKRSTDAPAPADLVSPPTPPVDAEPPKPTQPLLLDPSPSDGSRTPTAIDGDHESDAADEVIPEQHVDVIEPEPPQPSQHAPPPSAPQVTPKPDVPAEDCAAGLDAAPTLPESTNAAVDDKSDGPNGGNLQLQATDNALPLVAEEETATPPATAELNKSDDPSGGNLQPQAADNALPPTAPPVAEEGTAAPPATAELNKSGDPSGGYIQPQAAHNALPPTAPLFAEELTAVPPATAVLNNPDYPNGGNLQPQAADNALLPTTPLPAQEDAATPAAIIELKPARRFTRSLLKNKPDEGQATTSTPSQATPEDASVDSALLQDKPQRRFTRSLLKPKVEARPNRGSVESEDSTSESAPSVKKMEMKMSKKVACLTKHPGNIRELLNTGLLEGLPVMYLIPHSKRAVLKGVITGCNIRCFCSSCHGSKAVSAYYFEQHAGSNKKHPADYIYLGNGNSLRDVLRASERSPLEALEETIRSSIDPVVKRIRVTCLNCNGHIPPSQTECVLCCDCLESKEPQDPPTPSYACKSSLTPSSKGSLVKKICSSKKEGSAGKVTNKDTGLHKLVFNVLLDGTEVAYYVDGQRKVDGYIKDQRIYCNHCNRVVSPSAFEAHAGEGSRRKPYDNIFTSNGVSLHELSMKISKDMGPSERETDDLCRECGRGGDIFPCKICPRSFHPACVGLCEAPSEWYCDNCRNLVQKEKALAENKNAKAAGRQTGVDSIGQIMKRAIRIVPISDDLGGCAVCKQKDFNNAVFDDRTVILCDQCEKEYHVGCLRTQWQVDLKELPEGEWFCCSRCSEIRSSLDKIISDGAQLLPEPDMDIIRKKHEMRDLCMDSTTDLRWQLLSGRNATEDVSLLLSAAVPIFHQSFDPIIEAHTGRDLIPEMVNGRRPKDGMPGQDYSGMYCVLLTLGSTVVSAALLRVMGGDVAELPLVATSRDLQGLGYFQALFSCIERMLISLKVKHFMLPAAHEAEGIWMKKFGFSRVPQEQLEAYLNGAHLTIFHGTANLYKAVQLS